MKMEQLEKRNKLPTLRTIVTTDGECDDMNSFVRFLYYADEMDIRGIVLTSSCFHYAGDASRNISSHRWAGESWLFEYIDAYECIYENLRTHDQRYPEPDRLRKVTAIGNIKCEGDMEEDTEGSELIKKEILLDDRKTLYLQCWGGTNSIARALKSIEEEYGERPDWSSFRKKLSRRLVLYMIVVQDNTYDTYIKTNWPEITVIQNRKGLEALAFGWKKFLKREQKKTMRSKWQIRHVLHQENPLASLYFTHKDGRLYPGEEDLYQYGSRTFSIHRFFYKLLQRGGIFRYGDFLSEGDSPSFLFLVDPRERGLEVVEKGNWGGCFVKKGKNFYVDEKPAYASIGKYVTEMNIDFARRIRWGEQKSGSLSDEMSNNAY